MTTYLHSPFFLLLFLLVPFVAYRPKRTQKPSSNIAGFGAIPFILASGDDFGVESTPFYTRKRGLILALLRIVSLSLVIIALARPQSGIFATEENENARDLLITVDVSGSMKALDFEIDNHRVSRLEVLKQVVAKFVSARAGDRIGLIVFGTEVFTQCPLTLDHSLLNQYLESLEIGMAGDSTALGDALALSIKRLRAINSNSKAIILVTDGLRNSGQIDPKQAAEIANRLGIRVYTVGIGGKEPAPFPVEDMFGRTAVIMRDVPLDEETLKSIASITGGKYFNAINTDELMNVYKEIDSLELRAEKTPRLVSEEEHFHVFLIPGLILIFITELLSRTFFRVLS